MEITFLGTSGCVPTDKRNMPSVMLRFLGEYYLFDCGEGTQRQMRLAGINFMRIDHIFITHLHADHFIGLGGLIQSMDFLERDRPLFIHGPKGIDDTVHTLLSAGTFVLDHFEVKVNEVSEGVFLEGKQFTVSCFPTVHTNSSIGFCFEEKPHRKFLKPKALALGIPEGPLFSKLQDGFSVEVKGRKFSPDDVLSTPITGRKVVYTGDTKAFEKLADIAKNADVLIHDSTFSHADIENTNEALHSTTKQAAEIAKKANVKQLFLTHISQRYTEPKLLEEEAREIFSESYVAEDFMKVKVEKHW